VLSSDQLEQLLSDAIEEGHLHLRASQSTQADRSFEKLLIAEIGGVLQKQPALHYRCPLWQFIQS